MFRGPGWRGWYSDSFRASGSKPGEGDIFRTRSDTPCGPFSHLYSGFRVSIRGLNRPVSGVDLPRPSSAEVKERIELCTYTPSVPSPLVQEGILPFTVTLRL